MKLLRYIGYAIAGVVVALLLLAAVALTTVDRTPYQEMSYYAQWKQQVAQLSPDLTATETSLRVGWAKQNITPERPGPMAGYGNRRGKPYVAVHDSVYVRAIVLDNGRTKAAILSADLLIIPPNVAARLAEKLEGFELSIQQVYMGATHSHNSVGGWGPTITGQLFAGDYDPAVVETLAEAMYKAIVAAHTQLAPTSLTYVEAIDTENIKNRLVGEEGSIDPEIRAIRFDRQDGQRALLCTYAAHSTVIGSGTYQLSRDYPGALVDSLEAQAADFALFMAGAVGSMAPVKESDDDFEEVKKLANGVKMSLLDTAAIVRPQPSAVLSVSTLPLPLREPTPRLSRQWALRAWAFRWAFGDEPTQVKVLRLGDILMVGLPCDFSGELMAALDTYAQSKGLQLIVTSFNGGYAGYVTKDEYFDRDTYETITMSWYGPYNGAYFQEVIKDLINTFS